MPQEQRTRWLGELLVIVVGVLVALGVDDLMQYRADRELEAHLLERLHEDLVADEADLALARVQVARRTWFFREMARALAEGGAAAPPPDSLVNMRREAALLEAVGRPEQDIASDWADPRHRALYALAGYPQFDLSDDSYREMLGAGALKTLRDRELRSAILAYYRTAEDLGGNVTGLEAYMPQFREELMGTGVAVTDTLSLDEIVEKLRSSASLAARVREAQYYLGGQAGNLRGIERARTRLEGLLAARAGH